MLDVFFDLGRIALRHKLASLVVMGSIMETIFLLLVLTGEADNWPYLATAFAATFSIYLVTVYMIGRVSSPDPGWKGFGIVLFFAAAFMITMTLSQPILSWDVFRYYWDGKVFANGINPFLYSPGASQLSFLRDATWLKVNHKDLFTPYPPFAQLVFLMSYLVWPNVTADRIDYVILDLLVVVVLYFVLKKLGQPTLNVLIYAWSPLIAVEIGQSSHNDMLAVFLVVLSFLMILMKKPMFSSFTLALASISKYYPLLLAPLLFRKWGLKGVLLYLAVILVSYLPFLSAGWRIFNGMFYIATAQSFNSSFFASLQWIINLFGAANPGQDAQYLTYVIFIAIFFIAVKGTLFSKDSRFDDIWTYSLVIVGGLLLLTRALFPWYLTWIIPYLCYHRSKAWILLTGTVMLSYLNFTSFPPPEFQQVSPEVSTLISVIEYVPFFALLGYELLKQSNRRKVVDEKIRAN